MLHKKSGTQAKRPANRSDRGDIISFECQESITGCPPHPVICLVSAATLCHTNAGMANPFKSIAANIDREAWLRFFLALAGLALAFATAVFSAAASEGGNVIATVVFASTALLLSGVVGVLSVPYLFKRVVASRMREAFHYDLTREGVVYMVVVLVIAIAALNTANNLLFIVLAAMLAAIVVSGIASAAVLRGLELDVD